MEEGAHFSLKQANRSLQPDRLGSYEEMEDEAPFTQNYSYVEDDNEPVTRGSHSLAPIQDSYRLRGRKTAPNPLHEEKTEGRGAQATRSHQIRAQDEQTET